VGLGVLLLVAAGGGALVALRWPSQAPALDCPPSQVHLDANGVAHCAPGAAPPAGQVLTVGGKLDLNRATADDLAAVPGLGKKVAQALVDARAQLDGGFTNWDEVDRVVGVGEARLEALKATAEIREHP
jgi:competence protein ComEA